MRNWFPNFDLDRDSDNPAHIKEAVKDLYIYSCPLIEMARTRQKELEHVAANELYHARSLFGHQDRTVTTPNNDTLYSLAWLDLKNGPVTVTIPDTGERYISLAFLDMYTNNIAYMGTSQTGGESETRKFVAPGSEENEGPGITIATTPWIWVIGRILVDGEHDLKEGWAVQDSLQIEAPGPAAAPVPPPKSVGAPLDWLETVWNLIGESHPPPQDRELVESFRRLGLDDRSIGDDEAKLRAISEGIREAHAHMASTKLPKGSKNKWIFPKPYIGNFGQHFHFRAKVAMGGLGALTTDEAIYLRFMEGEGDTPLDGSSVWCLHFSSDQLPPVRSFWSLSLYEPDGEGRFFFVKNDLDRHSIGDRTPDLVWNDDGSLDIWMSYKDPGKDRRDNWLPAPNGPFAIFLRGYLPEQPFLNGEYHPPLPVQVN